MSESNGGTKKIRMRRVVWYAGYASFAYVVLGGLVTILFTKLHPYLALTVSGWWFVMFTFAAVHASIEMFRNNEEWTKGARYIVGAESEPFSVESVYGAHLTAIISLPFIFSFICKYLEATFPGSYSGIGTLNTSWLEWFTYSSYHYIDNIFFGSANLFGVWSIKIEANSFFSKAALLIYRIVIGCVYLSMIFITFKALRSKRA